MAPRNSSGFTLIELSIVLVIIGLLIGSVFVGRDLLRASQLRAEIKQIDQYRSAINSFRIKYNCLPGDCPFATSLFSGAVNGNGNGKIESFWINEGELPQVWYQLQKADLIQGSYTGIASDASTSFQIVPGVNAPPSVISPNKAGYVALYWPSTQTANSNGINNDIWDGLVPSYGKGNIIMVASPKLNTWGAAGPGIGPGWLSPSLAYAIDSKIDDGKPFLGSVVQWHAYYSNNNGSYASVIGVGPSWNTDYAAAVYNITESGGDCQCAMIMYTNAF